MIFVDPRNPTAGQFAEALAVHLPEGWSNPNVHLVIGGDGFLLHTAAEQSFKGMFLGLNAGRVGFLLNDVTEWPITAALLRNGRWQEHAFPLLEATSTDTAGVVRRTLAINDVVLERSTGQTAHLTVHIDGQPVVDPLVADGIIFATALGSTAYTFSAGGPACHPSLDLLAVTAICPHKPRLAPMLLPPGISATVEVLSPDRRPVRCATDGRHHDAIRRLEVRLSEERVRIAWLDGQDLTTRMVAKILRP